MAFDTDGLLGKDADEVRAIIHSNYPDIFRFCMELNRFAHALRNQIELNYDNQLHIVSVCLLQKMLDSFQATTFLVGLGFESDSNTILRSSLETLFIIRNLATDPHFITKYLGSDQIERRKLINIAKHKPTSLLRHGLDEKQLAALLIEINQDIDNLGLRGLSVEQLARECGLEQWYDLAYRMLSIDAHSLPRALERYGSFDSSGNFVQFDFTPKTNRTEAILVSFSAILLLALDSIDTVFKCGKSDEIARLHNIVVHWSENKK